MPAARRFRAVALSLVIASVGSPGAAGDDWSRRHWLPRGSSLEIGVDALGVIEWWERQEFERTRRAGRSSVTFRADSQTLLFHCGPSESLIVAQAPLGPDGSTDLTRRSASRCRIDEALYGDPQGGLSCRAFAGRIGPLPPDRVEIVVDGPAPVAVSAACVDEKGAIAAAFMPEALAPAPAEVAPPARGTCARNQSSVSFRGKARTGGACGR